MESNPLHPLVIPLHGTSSSHPWSLSSPTSQAARLYALNRFTSLHPSNPISEFVVSTHPSHKPAKLATSPYPPLRDHIETQVIEVDASMVDFYARLHAHGIPYVLKVVSVGKPQTLHVHPDETRVKHMSQGERLAKAVMLVAIDEVDMLFGFQSVADIVGELSRVPEFADAVGRPETDRFVHLVKNGKAKGTDIRALVENLKKRKNAFIKKCLQATAERFEKMPVEAVTESDRMLIQLREDFEDDWAVFAVYFLNRVMLDEGNAVFVNPGEPMCVLKGEFVEASTFSDFKVNGGLMGPQGEEDEEFFNCLSYDDSPVEISSGERFSEYGVSYVPPVTQFQLLQFKLPKDLSQQMVETIAPSVILVLDGEGFIKVDDKEHLLPLRAGSVYYLNPQTQFLVTASGATDSMLNFIQIGVNESAAPSMTSSCSIM